METLFDLEPASLDTGLELLDLRDDDTAFTSCRVCQTLTTAAGLDRLGHGPDSDTCARMLATYPNELRPVGAR